MWNDIGQVFVAEFSDISQPAEMVRVALRLLMAGILGGILGFEREHRGKAAGMRTHMLVAIGAALFVLLPQKGASEGDLGRVLQGLIAGVGFLCAGTIVKRTEHEQVQGLTTAAGIWLTAAIGVAAGLGRESTAILSTLLALLVLSTIPKFVRETPRPQ